MPNDPRQVHYFNIEPRHRDEAQASEIPQSDRDTIKRIFDALGTAEDGCYVNFAGPNGELTEEWKTLAQYRSDIAAPEPAPPAE